MKKPVSYGTHTDTVLRTHVELSRAFNRIRTKETAWLSDYDLTLAQFAIIEALYHLGALQVGEITRLILSTAGNITVVIKNLQTKNLITVTPNPEDKRIKVVSITQEGQTLMRTIFPNHAANLATWYDGTLSHEELVQLSGLLRKLHKSTSKIKEALS